MPKAKSQQSLDNWTEQEWGTKSGKPSAKTGERYLPKKAIASLSDSEYASTTRAKRKGTKAGKQHVAQPDKIKRKTRQFRNIGGPAGVTQAPPEFLQEIGEYSKAEPYNPLAEKLQKSLDRQKKISDTAMMVASPVSKVKGAVKVTDKIVDKAKEIRILQRTKDKNNIETLQNTIKQKYSPERLSAGVTVNELEELYKLQKKTGVSIFNFQNKYMKKTTPELIKSNDLKSKNILSAAINDLNKSKEIFKAGYVDVQGMPRGTLFKSEFDKIILGENKKITGKKLYDSFKNTRNELKKSYGNKITLYRLENNPNIIKEKGDKLITNWLPEGKLFNNFKNIGTYSKAAVIKKDVNIDDILGINTGGIRGGTYYEFMVLNSKAKTLLK